MNSRACLLVALLANPVWSQELVAGPPAPTPNSFDLSNASVKKIIRDAAATQFAYAQLPEKPAIEPPEPNPEPKPEPKPIEVPRLHPDPPPGGFLSQLIGIVLDEALFPGDDSEAIVNSDRWLRCEGREPLKSTQLGYDTCPAKNNDHMSPIL